MDYQKAITEVRRLLNSANKTFAEQIKSNPDISAQYLCIGGKYQEIIKFIEDNSTSASAVFEIYKLSAALGLLQCKINSFELSPISKEVIKRNDLHLSEYKTEIHQLLRSTLFLEEKFKQEIITEQDEYLILKEQMYSYNNNWKEKEFNLKAAYYYNYANSLLYKPPQTTESINEAITFFKDASNFYEKIGKETEKRETDDVIIEAKKLLGGIQLYLKKLYLKKCIAKIKAKYRLKHISIATPATHLFDTPTPPINSNTKEANMLKATQPLSFSLDVKRSRDTAQLESDEELLPFKKRRIEVNPNNSSSLANEELLSLENKTFAEIAASLETKNSTEFHFYFLLMNSMASFIPIYSDHDRLTKLQLSEMVADFIKSLQNSPLQQQQPLAVIEKKLNAIYQKYKHCVWNPLQTKELHEIKLTGNGLASLFISEIKAYYLSRKVLKEDSESEVVLNEVFDIVSKSIATSLINNTIQTIASHLMSLTTESEHLILENVLKTIEGFYMSSDQGAQNWLEENNIPIKPSNPEYQLFLGKLYNLISLHSPSGVKRIEFNSSGIPKLYFFKPQPITLTKEVFLTRLKEHLLMLKTDYISSTKQYSVLCNQLTLLITSQIEQQVAIDRNPVCPLSYPKVSI